MIKKKHQLSLSQRDDCETRKDTKNCITETSTKHHPSQKKPQIGVTINNESRNGHTEAILVGGGGLLKLLLLAKSSHCKY